MSNESRDHYKPVAVIRYSTVGVTQSKTIEEALNISSSNRVMKVSLETREFLILSDSAVNLGIPDGFPKFFPRKLREEAARRDLGRCRVCAARRDIFCIAYLGQSYNGNLKSTSIYTVCQICLNGKRYENLKPIPIMAIRRLEARALASDNQPRTLAAITAERKSKELIKSEREMSQIPKIKAMTTNQIRAGIDLETRDKKLLILLDEMASKQRSAKFLVKAKRQDKHERKIREAEASMCVPITVTTPDNRVIIVLPTYTASQLLTIVRERDLITSKLQLQIIRRDRGICRYCLTTIGEFKINYHIPIAAEGKTTVSNLVLACKDCNSNKSTSTDYAKWKKHPLSDLDRLCISWKLIQSKNCDLPAARAERDRRQSNCVSQNKHHTKDWSPLIIA